MSQVSVKGMLAPSDKYFVLILFPLSTYGFNSASITFYHLQMRFIYRLHFLYSNYCDQCWRYIGNASLEKLIYFNLFYHMHHCRQSKPYSLYSIIYRCDSSTVYTFYNHLMRPWWYYLSKIRKFVWIQCSSIIFYHVQVAIVSCLSVLQWKLM